MCIDKGSYDSQSGSGVYIGSDSEQLEVRSSKFTHITEAGVFGSDARKVRIVDNVFTTSSSGVSDGVSPISLVNIDDLAVEGNDITLNYTDDAASAGIWVEATASSNLRIRNNSIQASVTVTSYDTFGILMGYVADSVISDNYIKVVNNSHVHDTYGLYLTYVDRSLINSNEITMGNNGHDIGIYLDEYSDYNQGADNITYYVGTSISDAGGTNTVTAKDV